MSELICPRTQQQCVYGDFCAIRKVDTGPESTSLVKKVVQVLDNVRVVGASPALQEAQSSSYCSEQRIEAVVAATYDITASEVSLLEKHEAQEWAVAIAGGIITERECHRIVQLGHSSEPATEA